MMSIVWRTRGHFDVAECYVRVCECVYGVECMMHAYVRSLDAARRKLRARSMGNPIKNICVCNCN